MVFNEKERKDIRYKISTCADNMDSLDLWEQNFIESIHDAFYRTNFLTDNQLDKLGDIYEKVR